MTDPAMPDGTGFRFIAARDNAVVSLFVLIAMTQGLSLPGSIVVLN